MLFDFIIPYTQLEYVSFGFEIICQQLAFEFVSFQPNMISSIPLIICLLPLSHPTCQKHEKPKTFRNHINLKHLIKKRGHINLGQLLSISILLLYSAAWEHDNRHERRTVTVIVFCWYKIAHILAYFKWIYIPSR